MSESLPVFLDQFLKLHSADLADRLQRLDVEEARARLQRLPAENAAAARAEVEEERLPDLLAAFDAGQRILTTVTDVAGFFFFQGLATAGWKWLAARTRFISLN